MRLPNFIVIGAPKSGTTSLFYYLKQHTEVYLPEKKELHYFSYDLLYKNAKGPGDATTIKAICGTRKEYESYYADSKNRKTIGEFSPSYLYFSEVSERIKKELGPVKIIAILRNPVEKAHSQYMHQIRDNHETLGFNEALNEEENRKKKGWSDIWRYAESSLYSERVKKYISVFGKENVKVILFEDFVIDPASVLKETSSFLGIDPGFPFDTMKVYNRTGNPKSRAVADFFSKPNYLKAIAKKLIPDRVRIPMRLALLDLNTGKKDSMDREAERHLKEYFRKDVSELSKTLGKELNWLS